MLLIFLGIVEKHKLLSKATKKVLFLSWVRFP